MLPQPTALVDKRVCLAFSWLPFAIEQRTLARRAPVCQRSCTSASTDALERRARSTASRKSRHCMKHGKPTYMTACRERPSRAAPVRVQNYVICLVTGRTIITIPYAFCPGTRRERWRRALTIRESHIQLYMYAKLTQSAWSHAIHALYGYTCLPILNPGAAAYAEA